MNDALLPITIAYEGYTITTDKSLMNVQEVHQWLSIEAYWCKEIPFETVRTAFDNSYCIAALHNGRQIAYGRIVTDYATFGYLADVYVAEEHRGKGISKKMMQILFDLDWVKKLRHLALATRDAHELYKQVGFVPLQIPERYMQILRPNIYEQQQNKQ